MFVTLKFNHDADNNGTIMVHYATLIAFGHMMFNTPNITIPRQFNTADLIRFIINFETAVDPVPYYGKGRVCDKEDVCGRVNRQKMESFKLQAWNSQWQTGKTTGLTNSPFVMDLKLADKMISWIASQSENLIESIEQNPTLSIENNPTQSNSKNIDLGGGLNQIKGGKPFFNYFRKLFDNEDNEDNEEIPQFDQLNNTFILDSNVYSSINTSDLFKLEIYFNNILKDYEMLNSESTDFEDDLNKKGSIKSYIDSYLLYFYKLQKQFDKIISMNTYQILFIIYVSRFIWERARDYIVNMYDYHIEKCKLIENQIIEMDMKNDYINSLPSDNRYVDWRQYYYFNNMNKEEWDNHDFGLETESVLEMNIQSPLPRWKVEENVIILSWFRYIALNNISLDDIDNDYELIISKIESIDRFNGDLIFIHTKIDDDVDDKQDLKDSECVFGVYGSKSLKYKVRLYNLLKTNNGKKYLKFIKDNHNYFYGSFDIINEYMKTKFEELYEEFTNIKKLICLTLFIDIILDNMEKESKKFDNSEFLINKYIRRYKTFKDTIEIPEINEILTIIDKDYINLFEKINSKINITKLGKLLNNAQSIQTSVIEDNIISKIHDILYDSIPELLL
jgi:hypothetical protein